MSFQITKCNFTDDANVAKYNFVFLNCKLAAVAVVVLLPVYATGTIHCTSVPCSSSRIGSYIPFRHVEASFVA